MAHRGHVLANLARYSEAVISYDKAIAVNPDFADAWYNRGIALEKLGRYSEADTSFEKGERIQLLKDIEECKINRAKFFFSTRKACFLDWLLVFWLKKWISDNSSNYSKINLIRIVPFFLSYGINNFFVNEK